MRPQPRRARFFSLGAVRAGRGAAAALLGLCTVVLFWDYLSFQRLFLFTDIGADTVNIHYPRLAHTATYLREHGFPGWTFAQGIGQSLLPNSLGDPFEWPLLLLGAERLAWGIGYMAAFKVWLAGMLCYLYLEHLNLTPLARTFGSMAYAFSGFMILGGTWYTFSMEGVLLALLLLAYERLRRDGRWLLLVAAFCVIATARPFNLYVNGLFLAVYAVCREGLSHGFGAGRGFRHLARHLMHLAGLGALGAMIGAALLFPNLYEMATSVRAAASGASAPLLDTAAAFKTAVLRLFSSDLAGTGDRFTGAFNYLEAPMFYAGVATLLLAGLFPFLAERRSRRIGMSVFAAYAVALSLPPVRKALWLFTHDYYRTHAFYLALLLILAAAAALSRLERGAPLRTGPLAGVAAGLLALLLIPWGPARVQPDPVLKWAVAGLLILYGGLVLLAARPRFRRTAWAALLVVFSVELVAFGDITMNHRPTVPVAQAATGGYSREVALAAEGLRRADHSFFRTMPYFPEGPSARYPSLNGALVSGYYGTASYHRFNHPGYLGFRTGIGEPGESLAAGAYRWIPAPLGRPAVLAVLGVRYQLTGPGGARGVIGPLVARSGDIRIHRNPLALPLGFTYDAWLPADRFRRLIQKRRDLALVNAVVMDPRYAKAAKFIRGLRRYDPASDERDLVTAVRERAAVALRVTSFSPNRITGTVHTDTRRLMHFSFPYDPGWSARVDGAPALLYRVNFGLTGLLVTPGEHTVELTYRHPLLIPGMLVSLSGIVVTAVLLFRARRRLRPPADGQYDDLNMR